jgi:hypothetical protein
MQNGITVEMSLSVSEEAASRRRNMVLSIPTTTKLDFYQMIGAIYSSLG